MGKGRVFTFPRPSKGASGMGLHEAEAPELTDEETDNVDTMIAFSKDESNEDKLDFDYLVTDENMRNILDYNIPISDLPYLKVRKSKP
jgi:hypothetical protein